MCIKLYNKNPVYVSLAEQAMIVAEHYQYQMNR